MASNTSLIKMAPHHQIIVIVLFAFVMHTLQEDAAAFKARWNKYREECATEEGIDLAAANKAWEENDFSENSKFKCFYKCTNTKLGILDSAGEVVDEKLADLASHTNDKAVADEIVAECGHLKGAELCDTAFKLVKCYKAAILD